MRENITWRNFSVLITSDWLHCLPGCFCRIPFPNILHLICHQLLSTHWIPLPPTFPMPWHEFWSSSSLIWIITAISNWVPSLLSPCSLPLPLHLSHPPQSELSFFPFFSNVICSLCEYVCVLSCLTLWDSMDCCLPGSSAHGILQVSIVEWVAISSCRGSSWPRD